MTEPTREQIAWAAGLFEGEGCLNAYRRKMYWGAIVRLDMTDEDVVRRFAEIIGIGQVHGPRQAQKHSEWKPLYEWYVQDAADVLTVIELLLPWLGIRRKARALEVREIAAMISPRNAERTHCPKGHPYEGENLVIERSNGTGRRCRICRNEQGRERARKRLGIPPERWRV